MVQPHIYILKNVKKVHTITVHEILGKAQLLPDYQRGGCSTDTAFLKFPSDILWKMKRQQVTGVIALDLPVAFNTIDHGKIIKVLRTTFRVFHLTLD